MNFLKSLASAMATLALLASGVLLTASQASATTIHFDDLVVGTLLSNQYAGLGATFSPNAFAGPGTSSSGEPWATNTDMTIVSSTGADVGGLGLPPLVSGNILRSLTGWLGEDGDASFKINFSSAADTFSATFAGVSVGADVTLFAYDGAALIGTVSGSATGQFALSFSAPSITSMAIRPGSFDDWVGVDNITFTLAAARVPEPETYAMILTGLGLLGWVGRRRKRQAA